MRIHHCPGCISMVRCSSQTGRMLTIEDISAKPFVQEQDWYFIGGDGLHYFKPGNSIRMPNTSADIPRDISVNLMHPLPASPNILKEVHYEAML